MQTVKMLTQSIYRFLPTKTRVKMYRYRVREMLKQGLPEGIHRGIIDQVCFDHLRASVKSIFHVQVSGWKSYGAYRLLIETDTGMSWSLILKNEVYDSEHIPGLNGLPIIPGPPEYFVYKCAHDELSKYLPAVYVCHEIIPGKHYQYLLEDLIWTYRKLWLSTEDLLRASSELPALHRALNRWSAIAGYKGLLRFDDDFTVGLLDYARVHLTRYAQETGDETVTEVCGRWSEISEIYQSQEFREVPREFTIHGDYNRLNIYFHRKDKDRMKVVDWEWAGLGLPHTDLASLLKKVMSAEIEERALRLFTKDESGLSFEEHVRLYRWCQLGRGLLDGAYLAEQGSVSSRQLSWLPSFINGAMLQVLRACTELA